MQAVYIDEWLLITEENELAKSIQSYDQFSRSQTKAHMKNTFDHRQFCVVLVDLQPFYISVVMLMILTDNFISDLPNSCKSTTYLSSSD